MLNDKTHTELIDLTEPNIEAWLLANPTRAYAFGERLLKFMGNEAELKKQPSLGTVEDQLTLWATEHTMKARFLFMRLMGKIIKAKELYEAKQTENVTTA